MTSTNALKRIGGLDIYSKETFDLTFIFLVFVELMQK